MKCFPGDPTEFKSNTIANRQPVKIARMANELTVQSACATMHTKMFCTLQWFNSVFLHNTSTVDQPNLQPSSIFGVSSLLLTLGIFNTWGLET